jgi:hypothetical protein
VRRRIFSLASVLSLLLFAGGLALGTGSYWWEDGFVWVNTRRTATQFFQWGWIVDSWHGRISLSRWSDVEARSDDAERSSRPTGFYWDHETVTPPRYGEPWFGFERWSSSDDQGVLIKCPIWLPAPLVLLLPCISVYRRFKSRRRLTNGSCTTCGYELTGNTSGVCPECGTAIEAKG